MPIHAPHEDCKDIKFAALVLDLRLSLKSYKFWKYAQQRNLWLIDVKTKTASKYIQLGILHKSWIM